MISLPLPLPPVRRQNMKVRINATGDTIVMKFLRPSPDVKLEGYILGYGSNMFSKQFIQLPENGQPYETEVGKCQYGSLQRTQTMIEAQSLINKKKPISSRFFFKVQTLPICGSFDAAQDQNVRIFWLLSFRNSTNLHGDR